MRFTSRRCERPYAVCQAAGQGDDGLATTFALSDLSECRSCRMLSCLARRDGTTPSVPATMSKPVRVLRATRPRPSR